MRHLFVALVTVTACAVSAQTITKKTVLRTTVPVVQTSDPQPTPPIEKTWEKEPDAFLGIKLGAPLNVADCPTKNLGQYVKIEIVDSEALKSMEGVCIDTTDAANRSRKPDSGTRKLAHLPSLSIGYAVTVHLKDRVVSRMTIDLKQSSFEVLLTAFKDRYGVPTSIDSSMVKTNAGAEFNTANVIWKGKKLSIRMYERMSKVDESHVMISDNEIMEGEMVAQRARLASEAQKF